MEPTRASAGVRGDDNGNVIVKREAFTVEEAHKHRYSYPKWTHCGVVHEIFIPSIEPHGIALHG
jgi:hypothetical protein